MGTLETNHLITDPLMRVFICQLLTSRKVMVYNIPMLTLKRINNFLATKGKKERLAKGDGFYYFHGGDAPNWTTTAVFVPKLNTLNENQWLITHGNLEKTSGRALVFKS